MARAPRRRLHEMPVVSLVPSAITVLALLAGLTSIGFALQGKWGLAVFSIVVAAICDGLDGSMARLLNSSSRFGAELDSLSDFLSFGVAPALLLFEWTMQDVRGFGWGAVLIFATCGALRLARFNSELDSEVEPPAWTKKFFTGVPAPAGGAIAMLMLFAFHATGWEVFRSPHLNAFWLIIVGFLMVSSVPTFSVKKARLRNDLMVPAMVILVLVTVALISFPWQSLAVFGIAYLASVPFAVRTAGRLRNAEEASVTAD
jgi:CDP-diacylglycerol--serine O-phosphatidyltransferase